MGCNGSKQADSVTDSQKPEEPKGKPGRVFVIGIFGPGVLFWPLSRAEINKDYPSTVVGEQIFIAKTETDAF